MVPALSFSDSLLAGVESFARGIPAIIGALLILVIGWIISGIIARIVETVLNKVGADRLTKRAGIDSFLKRAGARDATAGGVAGFLVKWWIRLMVLEAFVGALGISAVAVTFDKIVAFIPSIFVALVIVVLGAFAARLAGEAVKGIAQGAGFSNAEMLQKVTQVTILVLAFIAALQQIHVAETLVNELTIAALATIAGACILAFGLGGRTVAEKMLSNAYSKGQQAQKQLSQSQPDGATNGVDRPRTMGDEIARAGAAAQQQQRA